MSRSAGCTGQRINTVQNTLAADRMRYLKPHDGPIEDIDAEGLERIIARIAERNHITAVYLFGSRARGDYDGDSDYDFLIDVDEEYRFRNYLDFKDTLSLLLNCDVDVVARRTLRDNGFARDVLNEMIPIYRYPNRFCLHLYK